MKTYEEFLSDEREKVIIDVRTAEEYEKETCPSSINIYWEDFQKQLEEDADTFLKRFDKNIPIYLMCYTGQVAEEIADSLEDYGYEAHSIDGGFRAYNRYKFMKYLEESREVKEDRESDEDKESGEDKEDKGLNNKENTENTENGAEQPVKKKKVLTRSEEIERSIVKKFRKPIWRQFTKAINDYELIKDGDKIAVCISGGKDSMLMAKLFQELKRHGKNNFELVFLVMNPGYNDLNYQVILNNAQTLNIPITVFKTEIFDTVADIDESPCYLCARMRRGYLYSKAKELGCNKIALGHHFDDVIETILMGMLYGGQIQTMMPKLHSTNFEGMELIRPMYLIREEDIIHWRDYNKLAFIQCACRLTESCASCGGTEKGSKRAEIKALIKMLAKDNPIIEKNIFKSVENVNIDTVITYKKKGVKHNFLDEY
ncbi:MAG: ATPase [Lachnospira sp.]|nr:ATPase [Lachnospira sp.]